MVCDIVVTAGGGKANVDFSTHLSLDFSFINAGDGHGIRGPSGGPALYDPPQMPPPTCSTVLPNGKTIGQVVQSAISNIESAAGDYDIGGAGEFGAFIATVQSGGPIDFKRKFGPDNTGALGDAGNFAYGAIASGIGYSRTFAELGAGAYAASHNKANYRNPGFEDNSAARTLPAGFATNGCRK